MGRYTDTDIGAALRAVQTIEIGSTDASADVDGDAVDRLGYLSAKILAKTGAATGTPDAQSLVFQLQESDASGSGYVAVDGATITIAADDTLSVLDVDLSARKRYLRVILDASESSFTGGSSPANDISCDIVLGGADVLPAA